MSFYHVVYDARFLRPRFDILDSYSQLLRGLGYGYDTTCYRADITLMDQPNMKMLAGKWKFAALGVLTGRVVAGLLVVAVAGCESGPSMEQLAPKIPKLKAEVPDSNHPEIPKDRFPNINNAPDRPSVMRSEAELGAIEDSLENAGETHVKKAVGRITGEEPEDDGAGEAGTPATVTPAAPAPGQPGQPVQLSPTE